MYWGFFYNTRWWNLMVIMGHMPSEGHYQCTKTVKVNWLSLSILFDQGFFVNMSDLLTF